MGLGVKLIGRIDPSLEEDARALAIWLCVLHDRIDTVDRDRKMLSGDLARLLAVRDFRFDVAASRKLGPKQLDIEVMATI